MRRKALQLIAVAMLAGCAYQGATSPQVLEESGTLLVLALAFVALLALAVAALGLWHARTARDEAARLAHALDGALRRLADVDARHTTSLSELSDAIGRDLADLAMRVDRSASHGEAAPSSSRTGNVVPIANAPRRPVAASLSTPDAPVDRTALLAPVALSLEPIISLSDSAAAGFEVHAVLKLANGEERTVRRVGGDIPASDMIRFDTALLDAAMLASRRQMGPNGRPLPLHVAVSRQFLSDAASVSAAIDLFRLHAGLANSIVMSLPAESFASAGKALRKSVDRLAQAGVRFAAEAWPDSDNPAELLASHGVSMVKIGANRLLDRERASRNALSGSDIAFAAGSRAIAVVATGVATDEDVVALLDLGVDLMCGEKFSPPRRLRPDPLSGQSAFGG